MKPINVKTISELRELVKKIRSNTSSFSEVQKFETMLVENEIITQEEFNAIITDNNFKDLKDFYKNTNLGTKDVSGVISAFYNISNSATMSFVKKTDKKEITD